MISRAHAYYHRSPPIWVRIIRQRVIDENGCWVYQGGLAAGYGVISDRNRQAKVHRWIYERVVGPIPDGYEIDHLCRNRACFNPDHLEAVTPYVNNMRSDSKCALQRRQDACHKGHPLTGENLAFQKTKAGVSRVCRTCRIESQRRYRRRLRVIELQRRADDLKVGRA